MDAKRELIITLFKKNKKPKDILKSLKVHGINRKLIYRTIKRFKETGSTKIQPKSGRKRTIRSPELVKKVRERIRRNPAQSMNKVAKDLKISQRTIGRVLKEDLHMKAFKKQKIHGLTTAQKEARVRKCKDLLSWHAGDDIIFSDEKMFILQDPHNQQNDRVYGTSLKDIPIDKLAVQRFQNHSAVMVWGAFSKSGKIPLLFIERGVKINQDYYIDEVLKGHLLKHASAMYGDDYYCFQQDSAPSHKAKRTQEWCRTNLPDFITPEEWPASSPDLNPLDFSAWGYMLSKIGSTKGMTLTTYKAHLIKIWDEMPMEVVRASCNNFFKRLELVIKAKGERFELFN